MLRRVLRLPTRRALSHVPIDDHFFGLSDEEIELRYNFRKFFENEIPPSLAKQIDESDDFPDYRNFMKKAAEMGFFGLMVPEEFGGTNLGIFATCLAGEEAARVHAGVSMMLGAHSLLAIHVIEKNGTDEQKEKFLVDLVNADKVPFYMKVSLIENDYGRKRDLSIKRYLRWVHWP